MKQSAKRAGMKLRFSILILLLLSVALFAWLRLREDAEPPRLTTGGGQGEASEPIRDMDVLNELRRRVLRAAPVMTEPKPDASVAKAEMIDLPVFERIQVLVVDEGGVPLSGIPVVLRFKWPRPGESAEDTYCEDQLTVESSGPDGRAEFKYFKSDEEPENKEIYLAVQSAFAEAIEIQIDLSNTSRRPYTLVVPASGQILVEIVTEGTGVSAQDLFEVTAIPSRFLDPKGIKGDCRYYSRALARVGDGVALLSVIALNEEFQIEVRPHFSESLFKPRTQRVRGPTKPDEVVALRIVIPNERYTITGRAVTSDGLIWRGLPLSVIGAPCQIFTTDEEGRFRVSLERPGDARSTTWELGFSLPAETIWISRTTFDFSSRPPGEYDVGDLVFDQLPSLVTGRVVNEKGEGIASASVFLRQVTETSPTWVEDEEQVANFHMNTDQSGVFVIRGQPFTGRAELMVLKQGFQLCTTEVAIGNENLLIELQEEAGLRYQVQLSSGQSDLRGLQFVLIDQDGKELISSDLQNDEPEEIKFKTGLYSVAVKEFNSAAEALYERNGVRLEPGKTLDLGKIVVDYGRKTLEMEVVLADSPTKHGGFLKMRVFKPGTDELLHSEHEVFRGEPLLLYLDALPVDVELSYSHFKTTRFTNVNSPARLELPLGFPLEVELLGLADLPAGTLFNIYAFLPSSAFPKSSVESEVHDSHQPKFSMHFPEVNRYKVQVGIGYRDEDGMRMTRVDSGNKTDEIWIEVEDNAQGNVQIRIDPEAAKRALEHLKR